MIFQTGSAMTILAHHPKTHSPYARAALTACLTVALLGIGGCGKKPTAAAPPPPQVGYILLAAQDATLSTEMGGRTVAFKSAEIRPQVSGIIKSRLFNDGAYVKAGQALYQLDDSTYRASMASAQASAQALSAKMKRYDDLLYIQAISKQDYDDTMASLKQARAAVESQNVNLRFARISAPISGIISKSNVTEGALVTAGQATVLTTIQQLDPIYVDVTESSTAILKLRQALASGAYKSNGSTQVHLILADGSTYGQTGKLSFSDMMVDEQSDSVTIRAVFPNPKRELLPGMFVRAVLDKAVVPQAIMIPQKALMRDPFGKAIAWVIGAEDKIEVRNVTVDQSVGNQWIITSGLQAGDRLVVDGFQKAKAKDTVKPLQVDPNTGAAVGGGAAAPAANAATK